MTLKQLQGRTSFAAGELSEELHARRDLARNQIGLAALENAVVLIEGGFTRRPGTRFVMAQRAENVVAKQVPFRITPTDNYNLVFNDGVIRFVYAGGFIESAPGVMYELAMPYATVDLGNLRWHQDGARMYLFCAGYQDRVLTRISHTNWTLTTWARAGGPVDIQNLNTGVTIQASAFDGVGIALFGTNTNFGNGDVGGIYRLDEPDLTSVPLWKPSEIVSGGDIFTGVVMSIGNMTGNGGLAAAADNVTTQNRSASANRAVSQSAYIGANIGGANISRVRVFAPSAGGPIGDPGGYYGAPGVTNKGVIEMRLYGRVGLPANGTDGTLLASVVFTDSVNEQFGRDLYSNDIVTAWDYGWIYMQHNLPASNLSVAELQFFIPQAVPRPQRRYNGRVYEAATDGDTGGNPPTHEEGLVSAGGNNVTWRFLHNGYGFVLITQAVSPVQLTGTVLSRLPNSVVDRPTYRWSPPAWSQNAGWPEIVAIHDQRIFAARANKWWMTRPSDRNSFEVLNIVGDAANPDSALAIELAYSKKGLPWIQWAVSAPGALILGLRDEERIVRAPTLFAALTVDSVRVVPATAEGSAAHIPADVDAGVLFIGRNRRRLHFASYENLPNALSVDELTKTARHILRGLAAGLAWQRDPNRIAWVWCQDRSLVGLTFMPSDQVVAWHRHPMRNGEIEDGVCVASTTEDTGEVYFCVKRHINTFDHRYVEKLQDFFEPQDINNRTAVGAWFVDCGLRYNGPPVQLISGLNYLEGEEVCILADGAMLPDDRVVPASGQLLLDRKASEVLIGKRIRGYVRTLPFELETPQGTSKGKRKRASHVVLDLVNTGGGRVRVNGGEWSDIIDTGTANYAQPYFNLFTGQVRVAVGSPSAETCVVEIEFDHALPFTCTGIWPDLEAETG